MSACGGSETEQDRVGTKTAKPHTPPAASTRSERASFKIHHGALTLFVGGKAYAPLALEYGNNEPGPKVPVESGLNLAYLHVDSLSWTDPDRLDTDAVDSAIKRLAELPSSASLRYILSIRVDPPIWWLENNPSQQAGFAVRREAGSNPIVSWASTQWQHQAGAAMERLIRYVLSTRCGTGLIGVQLKAGQDGAWSYPEAENLPDTGPCMTAAFVKYTVEKYRRNTGLLRKAWFDTRAEFSHISCPTASERGKADYGVLRNPHRSRRLMDYYECLANAQSSAALSFCSVIKHLESGSLLAGLESSPLAPDTIAPECGHSFLEPLLASDQVDFFVETGGSASATLFRPYRGSAALHGKFVFARSQSTDFAGSCLAAGSGVGAIVSAPAADDATRRLAVLSTEWEKTIVKPRKLQTQIALILDPGSSLVVSPRSDCAPVQRLFLEQIEILSRAGVSYSTYAIGDMFHPAFPNHSVYLMPNCFYISEPERRKLDARVKRSNQTAAWFWAPGVVGEEAINAEAGLRCCGQKMRIEPGAVSLRTRLTVSDDPLTWGRHAGDTFASDLPASPSCTVADAGALRLGANSANKTTFSVRRFESWTSVVYGTLPVPLDLILNLFRGAACHVYCSTLKQGDLLTGDGRALALFSRSGGAYTLSLPGQFDVTSVLDGERYGMGMSEITVSLSAGQAALFGLGLRPLQRGER